MGRGLVLAMLVVFALPSTAFAGSVDVRSLPIPSKYTETVTAILYSAAPGERNRLTVSRDPAGGAPVSGLPGSVATFVLRDDGAQMIAGTGCTAIGERTVRCAANVVVIDAGDGDDGVTVPPQPSEETSVHASGGDGADAIVGAGNLSGGPGRDVLAGAPTTCAALTRCRRGVLAGGAGDDVLLGGAGDEVLIGDGDGLPLPGHSIDDPTPERGRGNDVIDGGAGRDEVLYSGRRPGVRVDLANGVSEGAGGERDRLAGIEDATGGDDRDVLIGDGGANVLTGGPGSDRLSGRSGDDELLGNRRTPLGDFEPGSTAPDGADALHGGDGDDLLNAGGERGDTLFGGDGNDLLTNAGSGSRPMRARIARCGRGNDRVAEFQPQGQLLSDCERLLFTGFSVRVSPRPRRRGDDLRFIAGCATIDIAIRCTMTLTLRRGSARLTRRSVSVANGEQRAFRARLQRSIRRDDVVEISISGRPTGAKGATEQQRQAGRRLLRGYQFAARWRTKV